MNVMQKLGTWGKCAALWSVVMFSPLWPAPQAQAGQIELTANQLYSTWDSINGALTVIAANTSMDDDWTAEFKAMEPEPASGKSLKDVVSELHTFHAKLNVVLEGDGKDPLVIPEHLSEDTLSGTFQISGELMDALIVYLNATDPLAFIAHYYLWTEGGDKSMDDAYAVAALANKRMDVYMEENGIEMPEADGGEHAGHGG